MLPSRLAGGAPGGQHGKGGHVLSKVKTKGAMFNSIDRRLLLLLLVLFPSSGVAGMVLNIIIPLCPVLIHPPPLTPEDTYPTIWHLLVTHYCVYYNAERSFVCCVSGTRYWNILKHHTEYIHCHLTSHVYQGNQVSCHVNIICISLLLHCCNPLIPNVIPPGEVKCLWKTVKRRIGFTSSNQ